MRAPVFEWGALLDFDLNSDYIQSEPQTSGTGMKFSHQIKPISYLKARAAEVIRDLEACREPLVITQNGEAKAVIQDIASYEQTQETLALLRILALGNRQIDEGKVEPATDVLRRLRKRRAPR